MYTWKDRWRLISLHKNLLSVLYVALETGHESESKTVVMVLVLSWTLKHLELVSRTQTLNMFCSLCQLCYRVSDMKPVFIHPKGIQTLFLSLSWFRLDPLLVSVLIQTRPSCGLNLDSNSTLFWSQFCFELNPLLFSALIRTQPSSVLSWFGLDPCLGLDLFLTLVSVLIWSWPFSGLCLDLDSTLVWSWCCFKLNPLLVSVLF